MELAYTDFNSFFHKHFKAAYRLAFLLCRHPAAAESAVLNAMLALAASTPQTPETDTIRMIQRTLEECEGYYLKKPHRANTREQLQKLVPFPISDALWQAMKQPFGLKAAVFLRDGMRFTPAQIAQSLHRRERAIGRLLSGTDLNLACADEITAGGTAEDTMLDDIRLRFTEHNVSLRLKLRRFKRRLDKLVPYIALAVILFCIAAVIYTANLPVS